MSIARTRTIGLGLGLVFLAAVGASTLTRAQQPGEAQGPPKAKAPSRAELRERIIKLRVDVDVLQLDFDGARAALVKRLQDTGEADLMGIDLNSLMGAVKLELGGITGNAAALKEMSDVMTKLDANDPKTGIEAIQKASKKGADGLRAAFDRKKNEFAKLSRRLNEKKLDLTDAERQYQHSEAQ